MTIPIARGNSDYSVIAVLRRHPRDELNHRRILLPETRAKILSDKSGSVPLACVFNFPASLRLHFLRERRGRATGNSLIGGCVRI